MGLGDNTPVKRAKCFCCLESNPWRLYVVGGVKWKREAFQIKFQELCGINIESDLEHCKGLGLCHSCEISLNKCWTLVNAIKDNVARIGSGYGKREGRTPEEKRTRKKTKTSDNAPRRKLFHSVPDSHLPRTPVSVPETVSGASNEYQSVLFHNYERCDEYVPKPSISGTESDILLRDRGVNWNSIYHDVDNLTQSQVPGIKIAADSFKTENVVLTLRSIPQIDLCMKRNILKEIESSCIDLTSNQNPSVLRANRHVKDLIEGDLPYKCLDEMCQRSPFLLDLLVTVATSRFEHASRRHLGALSLVHSILMYLRNEQLSAYQRVLTLVTTKGSINEQCLITLNKLGVTLSPTSKITLLDECAIQNKQTIIKALKTCPLCNLVGDNCDIRIHTRHQASDHQVQDCHYFAILLFFSRIVQTVLNQSIKHPVTSATDLQPEKFLITTASERMLLLQSYKVLLGRRLAKYIPALEWIASVLPDHIPHRFSDTMSKKSTIVPSRLMILNEAKYEDCVQILDNTEDILRESFSEALGSTTELEKMKVPFGGDQLTRIRLQYAKPLRAHAPNPVKRFEDVGPFICTMWHNKQDFLHKAYRRFYDKDSGRVRGSLFYFKVSLRRTSVNGKVKNNYTGHEELFLLLGDMLMTEQALEYLGMETYQSQPTKISIPDNIMRLPRQRRVDLANNILMGILNRYEYGRFSLSNHMGSSINPPANHEVQTIHVVTGLSPDGAMIVTPQEVPAQEDKVMSYCNNLTHWAMHLMHMNDTAKEGDIDRMVLACKANIPFFYAHSKLSKYFVENIDILLKTQHLSSPQMQLRLLEGSYVNPHGGEGNNVETDLVMEHSVRNKKDLIRQLGANKTEKATQRASLAADTVAKLTASLNRSIGTRCKSSRHTKRESEADKKKVQDVFRQVRPFQFMSGRMFDGGKSQHNIFRDINLQAMRKDMERVITRLCRGQIVEVELDDECEENDGLPSI